MKRVLLAAVLAVTALAVGQDGKPLTEREVHERTRDCLVRLKVRFVRDGRPVEDEIQGFFVDPTTVVAVYHLIERADRIRVFDAKGKELRIEKVRRDGAADLAALTLLPPTVGKPVRTRGFSKVSIGDDVYLMGGSRAKTTVVSKRDAGGVPIFEVLAKPKPGLLGASVVGVHGEVIGILQMFRTDRPGLAVVIPTEVAQRLCEQGGGADYADFLSAGGRIATLSSLAVPATNPIADPRPVAKPPVAAGEMSAAKDEFLAYLGRLSGEVIAAEEAWSTYAYNPKVGDDGAVWLARLGLIDAELQAALSPSRFEKAVRSQAVSLGLSGTDVEKLSRSMRKLSDLSTKRIEATRAYFRSRDAKELTAYEAYRTGTIHKGDAASLLDDLIAKAFDSKNESFRWAMSARGWGAFVFNGTGAWLDLERSDRIEVRNALEKSQFKGGDVVTGIRVSGGSAFTPIRTYHDLKACLIVAYRREDVDLEVRVRRGTEILTLPL